MRALVLKNNLKLSITLILCLFTLSVLAQDIVVQGTVKDEQGVVLPGVSVLIDGTQKGTVTDVNGKYSIRVSSEKSSLTFKYLGFLNEQVVVGNKRAINVTLHASTNDLDQVVVVGYGTQKKSDVISSVASIKAEDATRNATLDVGEMLRGKAAGVVVTTGDAGPGGSSNIIIRGSSSLKGNNSPIVIADGVQIGAINDLNPNDIASIEVLKDAAAQAIYGARASNGVILITTKRGKAGKSAFNYGGYYGTQTVNRNFDVYSGPEFAQLKREADRGQNNNIMRSDDVIFSDDELQAIAENRSIDWTKEILQPARIQNHDFSVSSGSEKTRVYLSGNYQDMEGLVPTTGIRKATLRGNIDQDIKSWLSVGLNLSYQNSKSNDPGISGILRQIVTASPLGYIYNADGSYNVRPGGNQESFNPLLNLHETNNDKRARNDILNVYVDIKPFKGFKNRINASRRSWNYKETNYNTKLSESGVASGSANGYIYFQDNREWMVENITTYDMSVKKHNFNFTGVLSALQQDYNNFRNSASKIPNDILGIYGLEAALINVPTIEGNRRGILSGVGRIQYDYDSRYYVTLSARADGSTVFGANNKWGYFPAIALGWNLYKEKFMSDFNNLSNLKLRFSYGSVGNEAIGPYGSLSLADQKDYIFGDDPVAGYVPGSTLPNPDLRWETSTTLNTAVDFGFYNGRVSGTVEYYDKRTTDLLVDRLLNQSTGYSKQPYNIGETQNKGLEIQFNAIPVSTRNFKFDFGVLFSKNINKIISLYGKDNDGDGVEDNDKLNDWYIGQPISVYYQPKFIGIWQGTEVYPGSTFNPNTGKWEINGAQAPVAQVNGVNIKDPATGRIPIPGGVKLEDRNGDGQITPADNYFTSKYPDWTGSLNLGASYKNFDFSMDIYTVQGITRNNQFLYDYTEGGDLRGNRNGIKVDYWTPENPSNTYPQPNAGTSPDNMFNLGLQDASFWRLQNVTIAYTFPTSMTSKLKLSNLRIYATGQNLITKTDYQAYSPEQDLYSYPTTKNFIVGLKVGF